jgi:hypothetical protein
MSQYSNKLLYVQKSCVYTMSHFVYTMLFHMM